MNPAEQHVLSGGGGFTVTPSAPSAPSAPGGQSGNAQLLQEASQLEGRMESVIMTVGNLILVIKSKSRT